MTHNIITFWNIVDEDILQHNDKIMNQFLYGASHIILLLNYIKGTNFILKLILIIFTATLWSIAFLKSNFLISNLVMLIVILVLMIMQIYNEDLTRRSYFINDKN